MDFPVQDLVPSTLSQWRLRCWANSRFRLASNAFPDIESVGRIEKKKKTTKKNSQEVSEQEALVPQDDVES